MFGGLAKRYKFRVKISPESEMVRSKIGSGMSGVSGGVMGYEAMRKEFGRITEKIKSLSL